MMTSVMAFAVLGCGQNTPAYPALMKQQMALQCGSEKHDIILRILEQFREQYRSHYSTDQIWKDLGHLEEHFRRNNDLTRLERVLLLQLIEAPKAGITLDYHWLQQIATCQLRLRAFDRYESTMSKILSHEQIKWQSTSGLQDQDPIEQYLRHLFISRQRPKATKLIRSLIEEEEKRQDTEAAISIAGLAPSKNWKYRFMGARIAVAEGNAAAAKKILSDYAKYEKATRLVYENSLKDLPLEDQALGRNLGELRLLDPTMDAELKCLTNLCNIENGNYDAAIQMAETALKDKWRLPFKAESTAFFESALPMDEMVSVDKLLISGLLNRLDQLSARDSLRIANLLLTTKGAVSRMIAKHQKHAQQRGEPDTALGVKEYSQDQLQALSDNQRRQLLVTIRNHIASELYSQHVTGTGTYERIEKLVQLEGDVKSAAMGAALGVTRKPRTSIRDLIKRPIGAEADGPSNSEDQSPMSFQQMLTAPSVLNIVDCREIQASLGDRQVALDFQRRLPDEFSKTAEQGERYYVVVIKRQESPRIIDLGPASIVDSDIDELGRMIKEAEGIALTVGPLAPEDHRRAGQGRLRFAEEQVRKVSRRLLESLLGKCPDVLDMGNRLLISPVGRLWELPWACLVKENGSYLIEENCVTSMLSADGVLAKPLTTPIRKAVIISNPDYGALVGIGLPKHAKQAAVSRSRGGAGWEQLEGFHAEAEYAQSALTQRHNLQVEVVSGRDATLTRVLNTSDANILHLATHGYAIGVPNDMQSSIGLLYSTHPSLAFAGTGVVLAGANLPRAATGLHVGVLTGLQVVSMDLKSAQLVILSACETALGQNTTSEGVLGITKAFQLAGARHIVSTLWSVPDKESKDLVVEFYKQLDMERMDESLQAAQRNRIRDLRAGDYKSAHPYFWAGYALTR